MTSEMSETTTTLPDVSELIESCIRRLDEATIVGTRYQPLPKPSGAFATAAALDI
jgi:hypothetical protein